MPQAKPSLTGVGILLGLLATACAHPYSVPAAEAQRLLQRMGEGARAPSPNSMLVPARRADESQVRWIELWADDLVGVEWENGGLQSRWARIEDLPAELPITGLRFRQPQGTGDTLMYAAAVFAVTGTGMQLVSAAWSLGYNSTFDEPLRPETFIPYYGNLLLIEEGLAQAEAECGHDKAKCAYNIYNAAYGMVSFAVQAASPLLLIAGALWPDGRERDPPDEAVLTFDPVPLLSSFAEGGLLLTWRF